MEVKIEKLIYGGEGLAHQDGATVFVPFVLPGEQVTVTPAERKKKFVRAKLVKVLEASPERVGAPCPHFGICGGCDYQHIPYEAQLKYKVEILRETLRRLGRIDWTGEITAHGSPPWGYRNRAQWKVRPITERDTERSEERGEETTERLAENSPRKEAVVRQSFMSELKLRPPKNRGARGEAARGGDGAISEESAVSAQGDRALRGESGEELRVSAEGGEATEEPSGILAENSPRKEAVVRQSLMSELKLRLPNNPGKVQPPKNRDARGEAALGDKRADRSAASKRTEAPLSAPDARAGRADREERNDDLASVSSNEEAEIAFRSAQNRLAGSVRMQGAIGAPHRKNLSGPVKGSADKTGRDAGGTKLATGYFRANSTALCAVETCEIISPLLLKTLRALRDAGLAGEFPRTLRELEAVADASDSKLLLTATFAGFPARAAEVAEKMRKLVPEIESLLFFDPTRERMELFGPGFIEYEACGTKFRVGHFSFFQVNRFLVDELARVAVEGDEGGRLALDLFAGVGLFSVGLAKRFDRVVAVESNPAAARDLEGNIRGAGVEVRAADVETFLRKYKEKPDLALLDPPRAGLEPEGLKSLARIGPKRITYVSCEPPTLARDLAGLLASGYEISEVHLFDLFPQTFHMEAVVRLKRRA